MHLLLLLYYYYHNCCKQFALVLLLIMHLMACGLFIVPTIEGPSYSFKDKNGVAHDPVGLQYVYGIYVSVIQCTNDAYA
jgi:hypothetical protein